MGIAPFRIDSASAPALTSTMLIPVLDTAPTLTGFSQAGPAAPLVTLSTLATFFAANAGPVTTAGPITITGTGSAPAGTVRYIGSPAGTSTSVVANVPTGGTHQFRVANTISLSVSGATSAFGAAGAAYALSGTTTALTTDAASGAITVKANIGTGAGAVGGFIFQVPVTHGSDAVAQTLTTVLTLGATTFTTATFAGKINCAVSTTAFAGLNLGNAGTAPTAPVDGDMWIESNTIKVRLNGATKTVTVA